MKRRSLTNEKARRLLRAGHTVWTVWGHLHTNRFVSPPKYQLEVYVRPQFLNGKRKHQDGVLSHLLNGSWGPYFRRQKHAEAFAKEIRDGKHPRIVAAMQERDDALDLLDEEMGICDRGLGVYEEDQLEEHAL
jgi:hypothetical protein